MRNSQEGSQHGPQLLDSVQETAERLRASSAPGAATAAARLADALQATTSLTSREPFRASGALEVALHDAQQLSALSAQPPGAAPQVLAALVDRVCGDLMRLEMAAAEQLPTPSSSGPSGHSLDILAKQYGKDADKESGAAGRVRALALFCLLGSAAAAYWAVQVATQAEDAVWPTTIGPLLVCAAAGATALLCVRQAAARDRAGREYRRLERGLSGVDAYLAPLPSPARHLLRATMTQSLFPRLLDDDDPLKQPAWPDADVLLQSVAPVESPPDPAAPPSATPAPR